jgi:hypothetical protein
LFFLNAAIWILFGVWSLLRVASSNPSHTFIPWLVAILMFGNAGAMLGSGIGLKNRQKRFYYLAVVVLAVNIILTVTDQFGILDLITLMIDVVLLGFVLGTRKSYAHQ